MSVTFRPRDTTPAEDAQALGVAVGAALAVGTVTFWVVRTLLGRDAVELEPGHLPAADETRTERRLRPGGVDA